MRTSRHVIIDAFNVMLGRSEFRKALDHSREGACQKLLEFARVLHDSEGHQLTVVFDGIGERMSIDYPQTIDTFAVVYSPSSISADGIVERMVSRSVDPDHMIVVSNDHMVRDAALAYGAEIMGVDALIDWIHGCKKTESLRMQSSRKDSGSRFTNRLPL